MSSKNRVIPTKIDLRKAVLRTILYADVFDSAIETKQVYLKLISNNTYSSKEVSLATNLLLKAKLISKYELNKAGEKKTYLSVKGRECLFSRCETKIETYNKKYNKLYHILNYIKPIPFIEAIYVTGSLAAYNPNPEDDIDLMVVTTPGRLWITRFCVWIILELLQVRRKPEEALHTDKICTNMYIDSKNLQIPNPSRNLYTAHEVVQAKNVFDRKNIKEKFLYENRWVGTLLAQTPLPFSKNTDTTSKKSLFSPGLDLLELVLYKAQLMYMSSKKTTEVVDRSKALFHPRDTRGMVLKKYQQKLEQLGLS